MYKFLKESDIREYLFCSGNELLHGDFSITKIEKGKMNSLYKLTSDSSCYVLKQAGKRINAFNNVQAPLQRNINEANAIKFISGYYPEITPEIIHIDNEMALFIMNSFIGYSDIRDEILQGNIPKGLISSLVDIFCKIFSLSPEIHLVDNNKTMNFLLNKLLFEIPYSGQFILNNNLLTDKAFYIKELLEDELFIKKKNILLSLMNNSEQVILHGDLHLGAVCSNGINHKLYDFEFSFLGPIGVDVGKIVAHLILGWCNLRYNKKHESIDFSLFSNEISSFPKLLCNKIDYSKLVNVDFECIEDQIKIYCGVELISRVTGLLQLHYITNMEIIIQNKLRIEIVNMAKKLILDPVNIEIRDVLNELENCFL